MGKSRHLVLVFLLVAALLAGCSGELVLKGKYLYQPPEETTQDTAPTAPSVTEPEPTVPQVTEPEEPVIVDPIGDDHIGPYSKAELEALDKTNNGYGPGPTTDELGRPHGAMQLNDKYTEKYDAWFIGPEDGNIYLTFDLGWENEGLTHDFLDTLKEKNVKAVFFVLKEYCDANPDIIRRVIDEGHILGSHAYRHKTLANLTLDQIVDEIWKLHLFIREEYGYEMKLFRPPSGEFSEQVLAVAHGLGYRTVNWSYAYVDWLADDQPEVGASLDRLMRNAHSGCIYLLHTVSTTNAQLLGDLIDGLRAEGYEFALFTTETA